MGQVCTSRTCLCRGDCRVRQLRLPQPGNARKRIVLKHKPLPEKMQILTECSQTSVDICIL